MKKMIIDGLQYSVPTREFLKSLVDGSVSAIHVTLVYHENARETLSRFAAWNRRFEENSDLIIPVMSVEDIDRAESQGKVGVFFGAQNCSSIEDEIGLIEVMRKQGLLIMQPTYNNQSLLAGGCYESADSGITRFGKQAIKEMNRVGMILDMSHSGERSTIEAIEISERPICISHAIPSFVRSSRRSKSNTVLKALADSGGILGFSLYPFHLPNGSECSLEQFCGIVADTAELMGVEHLGIGSDLCLNQPQAVLEWMRNGRWSKVMDYGEGNAANPGWPKALSWFKGPEDFEKLSTGFSEKGFSAEEVNKIMGGNWYDFLKKVLCPVKS